MPAPWASFSVLGHLKILPQLTAQGASRAGGHKLYPLRKQHQAALCQNALHCVLLHCIVLCRVVRGMPRRAALQQGDTVALAQLMDHNFDLRRWVGVCLSSSFLTIPYGLYDLPHATNGCFLA